MFLWPDNASASQEFDLLDSGGGYFRIRARHSGQCLTLDWRTTHANGTRVIQYPYCSPGNSPAEWRRGGGSPSQNCQAPTTCTSTGTEYPVLINRATHRCLDARNPSGKAPRAQAVLQQWDCIRTTADWNAENQL